MQPPCPDLTKGPPRSPRERLAGVVHLPRLLDKARARSGGRLGEYIYPCPLDQKVLGFLELEPEAVAEAAVRLSDDEMDAIEAAASEIAAKYGVKVTPVACDITTEAGRAAVLAACPAPDILVNNNGGPPGRDFRQLDRAAMVEGVVQNMVTPIELIRAVIDGMA